MKYITLGLLLVGLLIFSKPSGNTQQWIADFDKLKEEMVKGYANLKFSTIKEGLDLAELNKRTTLQLEQAKSKEDAQEIIMNFLKIFNDGHLRARKYRVPDKNLNSDKAFRELNSNDSAFSALTKMAYEKRAPKFPIQYDSVAGYEPLTSKENPFPLAIIKKDEDKIGVLRIGFFGYWRYWDTALSLWEEHSQTFEGNCDNECQWTFTKMVEKELTQKLIQQIDLAKSLEVDALIVDVSGNGGGTEWYEAVARLFSDSKLRNPPFYVVKHTIWQNVLSPQLKLIDADLANPDINVPLKNALQQLKDHTSQLLESCINHCDPNDVWSNNNLECLDLLEHAYAYELPEAITEDKQFRELHTKNLIQTNRFLPFKRGIFADKDRLFIVQDRGSGSATEGFTSILQSNEAAIIVGETSYGAGCGYTNGGQEVVLEHLDLVVKMPDCVRLRKDGTNEIYGIKPDIAIGWEEDSTSFEKGALVIDGIQKYIRNH
ncbi:S41 family peptidase [Flagellimonas aequoris]|uniref:Tail specific protease domain-containing protein n=1 Tax=Flagellimonas aequoris TaxID=2306997 RepID=A0A418N879_9FLAO|nr:S41 family peptidase [Allomuricauda aequoris]RIV71563.1 hypothetical protein D2U88_07295 [Allomuricauda aequoris]TXK03127.1 hypothetical protein FQ019_07240 [Allomuricauda aequoris]